MLDRSKQPLHTVLNSQVLVLNRLWQAVNICSVRRAFTLLYQGHAQVVSSDQQNNFATHDFASWLDFSISAPEAEYEMVTTISWKIRVPRVIVLLLFDRLPKKEVKFTRHNVFERDNNTCQYLRKDFRASGTESRSRPAARQRRPHDLGERRLFVYPV